MSANVPLRWRGGTSCRGGQSIHHHTPNSHPPTWVPGSSPGMTKVLNLGIINTAHGLNCELDKRLFPFAPHKGCLLSRRGSGNNICLSSLSVGGVAHRARVVRAFIITHQIGLYFSINPLLQFCSHSFNRFSWRAFTNKRQKHTFIIRKFMI